MEERAIGWDVMGRKERIEMEGSSVGLIIVLGEEETVLECKMESEKNVKETNATCR